MATKHRRLGRYVLGGMVYHGVENKLGVLIALGYALLNFLYVVSAQVGDEPCLARYFLQKLLLGIFAAETKAYEVGRRQRTGPDRKSTRLNSSHANISYAVFCLKKKNRRSNDCVTQLL